MYGLSAEQKDGPQCPPRMGNEVGSGVFHLEGAFSATAFDRREPDALWSARRVDKSYVHMDTQRHAHFCRALNRLSQSIASQGNIFHYTGKAEKNTTVRNSSELTPATDAIKTASLWGKMKAWSVQTIRYVKICLGSICQRGRLSRGLKPVVPRRDSSRATSPQLPPGSPRSPGWEPLLQTPHSASSGCCATHLGHGCYNMGECCISQPGHWAVPPPPMPPQPYVGKKTV